MRGIILAGGAGTRLYPMTLVTSKQLLPVYDKPMIYYPLSVLMLAGIRQVLIISTPEDLPRFEQLLGNGSRYGVELSYKVQPAPDGLAQGFVLAEEFLSKEAGAMVLGDNLFYGDGLDEMLREAVLQAEEHDRATVFGYEVSDPERFGIVEMNGDGKAVSIEEKPKKPKSRYCVTGLYFYPSDVTEQVKKLRPSERGELEITDLSCRYLRRNRLEVQILDGAFTWMDAGTTESLAEASDFVRKTELERGILVSAPEEVAYRNGWIDRETLLEAAERYGNSPYGAGLMKALVEK